jgi:hypothetical protein
MSGIPAAATNYLPPDALAAGSAALNAAGARLNGDAQQVANPGADPTGGLVDATQAQLQAQAAVAIIRTSNAMLGTLLDVRA